MTETLNQLTEQVSARERTEGIRTEHFADSFIVVSTQSSCPSQPVTTSRTCDLADDAIERFIRVPEMRKCFQNTRKKKKGLKIGKQILSSPQLRLEKLDGLNHMRTSSHSHLDFNIEPPLNEEKDEWFARLNTTERMG